VGLLGTPPASDTPVFLYDFFMNRLPTLYGCAGLINSRTLKPVQQGEMNGVFVLLCALCEMFLLRFLAALVKENRNSPSRKPDAHRQRSGRAGEGEEPLRMNSRSTGSGNTSAQSRAG